MRSSQPMLSMPMAVLLSSFVISIAILLHGGVIKIEPGGASAKGAALGKTETASTAPKAAAKAPAAAAPTEEAGDLVGLRKDDHLRGSDKARVLLIEYTDLECPFCKRFHPTAQQAVDEYKGQVAWVYRHFPLDQLHSKADKEAEAVECANEMAGNDGFWKLADKIYEVTPSNNGLNLDDLPKLASQVGLDQNKFKSCLDSGKYADKVESDYQEGISAGVKGTPGNFLLDTKTGKKITLAGAVSFDTLKSSIDSLLK